MVKNLIIDGNNLLYRAFHKFTTKSRSGESTSAIYGFPYILRSLIDLQSANNVMVVFDGKKNKHRMKAYPEYKGQRTATKKARSVDMDNFVKQQTEVKAILQCLCVPVIHKFDQEADDIIWLHARRCKRLGESVVIVSTDKDFNQLLSPNVSIWHPWQNKRITHKNVQEIYNYSPEECVDWLSLLGDKSDNIPGAKGIGVKGARKFLDEYGSILNYIKGAGEEMNKFTRSQAEELFYRNRTLIDLRHFARRYLKGDKVNIQINKGDKIDKRELGIITSKYDINSFTKDSFLKTFKKIL